MSKTAYLNGKIYIEHDTGYGHPERPERIIAIDERIRKCSFYGDLVKIEPAPAEIKYIELIHNPDYIRRLKSKIESGAEALDPDTCVSGRSFEVALQAVGGCLKMCDAVMAGKAVNGFCAIRPPGHHAERDRAAGFCLFNNIAIAARYLQTEHGIKKVAIVDWDVHHGNGTQHSFEDDDSILYISLHQYPHYPGTGSFRETGRGKGAGYTINFPMDPGSGDEDYAEAFRKEIIPSIDKFAPEIILISAGFDAHRSDQLASIKLSTDSYREFTVILKDAAERHCGGKLIAFLEGGYNLTALADSVEAVMKVLAGK
jgi:acetoin utilization deacetylase AcuC-like enzyme